MPKFSKKIAYKDPVALSAAQESAERVLQEVEAENLEYYERAAVIARNTSTIQSGIRLRAGKVIGDPAILRERIVEERVQSDLYRAIAGNEAVETGKGVDAKNYANSINARFLEEGEIKKRSRVLHKMKNAILGIFINRDFVNEEMKERFGESKEINDQKLFVAERHCEYLTQMQARDPVMYNNLLIHLNLVASATVTEVIDVLSKLNASTLRTLRDYCIANDIELAERPEFLDLLTLSDSRQRALAKFGMMEVYDIENLRSFWSSLTTGSVMQKDLTVKINKLLLNNSLIDLEQKPESALLISTVRARYLQLIKTLTPDQAANELKMELDSIETDELPKTMIPATVAGAPATPGDAEKVSPFVLVQRLLRRDYCARRNLDPKNSNLEADNFSSIQTAIRLADVKKNVDMFRSSNDKAAEVTLDEVEKGMDSGKILADIIKNHPEFKIFAGINKYTTRREIRQRMNAAGEKVAEPVMEKLIAILQEALSRYKKGPQIKGTNFAADDWDLEELVLVLQTLKAEQWSNKMIVEVVNDTNAISTEEKLISAMNKARKKEEEMTEEIFADVTSPEAIWKIMASKIELKKILNKCALAKRLELSKGVVEAKKLQISQLSDSDPQKQALEAEIKALERIDKSSADLADRVFAARKYIKEKKLSGRARDAYISAIGLAGVWDKMGFTFWKEDKKEAVSAWWDKKKESAGKWWKAHKEKKAAEKASDTQKDSKAWSIFKKGVSPVTGLGGVMYDVGSFLPRMIFRGAAGASRMPKRMVGMVSDSAMHSYLTERFVAYSEEISEIDEKTKLLSKKLLRAPYSWDSSRINKEINSLNLDKSKLTAKITALQAKASQRGLPPIAFGTGKIP